MEKTPQGQARGELLVVNVQGRTRVPISAYNAFVAFDREQDRLWSPRRDGGKIRGAAMDMPEVALFDSARRLHGQRESERVGALGELRLVRAHVDYCDKVLIRVEHRRATAAERRVPPAKCNELSLPVMDPP